MTAAVTGYILLGLSIAAPVGPINLEIIKKGLLYGFWAAFLVGLGGMTADLLLMGLMFFGLASVMQLTAIKTTLLFLGCIILVYSGWTSLRNAHQPMFLHDHESLDNRAGLRAYLTGMTIAASNPMNLLFWLSIYGSVLSDVLNQENHLQSFFMSSLVFVGIGLWNLNLAFTIHFGRLLMHPFLMKAINIGASLILIGFGLRFGVQGLMMIF